PVVVRSADYSDAAVGGQRDRGRGVSHRVYASQLVTLGPVNAAAGEYRCRADAPIAGRPAHQCDIAVSRQGNGCALAGVSRPDELVALLLPNVRTAGEHPCRSGGAKAKGHRSIPRVVTRPAHDGDVAIRRQRNGRALARASHSTTADELLALL